MLLPPYPLTTRYGFKETPRLELVAKPRLGKKAVTLSQVTHWIERKLCSLVDVSGQDIQSLAPTTLCILHNHLFPQSKRASHATLLSLEPWSTVNVLIFDAEQTVHIITESHALCYRRNWHSPIWRIWWFPSSILVFLRTPRNLSLLPTQTLNYCLITQLCILCDVQYLLLSFWNLQGQLFHFLIIHILCISSSSTLIVFIEIVIIKCVWIWGKMKTARMLIEVTQFWL